MMNAPVKASPAGWTFNVWVGEEDLLCAVFKNGNDVHIVPVNRKKQPCVNCMRCNYGVCSSHRPLYTTNVIKHARDVVEASLTQVVQRPVILQKFRNKKKVTFDLGDSRPTLVQKFCIGRYSDTDEDESDDSDSDTDTGDSDANEDKPGDSDSDTDTGDSDATEDKPDDSDTEDMGLLQLMANCTLSFFGGN